MICKVGESFLLLECVGYGLFLFQGLDKAWGRRSSKLLFDDFDEDAVGELAFKQVDDAAFDEAFEDDTPRFGLR